MVPVDDHKIMEVEGLSYPVSSNSAAFKDSPYQNQGFWNFHMLANEQYLCYLRHLEMSSTEIQEEEKKKLKIMAYQGPNLQYCRNID